MNNLNSDTCWLKWLWQQKKVEHLEHSLTLYQPDYSKQIKAIEVLYKYVFQKKRLHTV